MNENEQTNSFVMYETFFQYADLLLDDAELGQFVRLLRDYAIKGEDAHSSDKHIEGLLVIAKPLVSASTGRYKAALKGKEHGNKGAEHGKKGGRPRLGETKEEAYERRRKERELKEQELNQEPLPVIEPKTAVEAPENPINPLNDNDNIKNNEKINENENCNEKEEFKEKKSIDYYLELFLNYHYDFNYSLLMYEKDLFYSKYQYSIDKLKENIEKGTGNSLSVEGTLNYLCEYAAATGRIH